MALSYVDIGTTALGVAAATTIDVAAPTHAAGDILVAVLGGKPNSGSQNNVDWTATNWADLPNATRQGPAIVAGTDTGTTRCKLMYIVDTGNTVTTTTFTNGTGVNNTWGVIVALRATSADYDVDGANGLDSTGDASFTAAMDNTVGLAAGDIVVVGGCIPTDLTTPAQFDSPTLNASGITATVTERAEVDQIAGIDSGGGIWTATIDSGSGTVTATFTATANGTTTNVYGPIVIGRVREVAVAALAPPPWRRPQALTMRGRR